MLRYISALLLTTLVAASSYATELNINSGLDGPTRFLIFVDGTSGPDDIGIRFIDSVENGEVEYLKAEVYDGSELVASFMVPPSQAEDIYVVVRGWDGMDTCTVDSYFIVRPELFTVYFEGGRGDDTFDGQQCVSTCIVRGGDDNDVIEGGWGDDDLHGGSGYDEIYGRAGNDTLDGGLDDDNDLLRGGWGADEFGRDVYKPIQNRNGTYVQTLVHTENYDDFDADEGDTIRELIYPMPRTSRSRR